MDTLGARLKHAREARGLSLQEIADQTKISATALEAVERNDFSRLPGGIFGRSFIRAYALAVGEDPDTTVSSFVEALEESEREAAARGAVRPEITPDDQRFLERQRRAVMWLRIGIAVVVLLVLGVAAWQLRSWLGAASSEPTPPATPTVATSPEPGPPPVMASPSVVPPATPVVSEPLPPMTPSAASQAPSAGSTPAPGGSTVVSSAAAASPATASSAATAGVVVEITLTADCWVSATADAGAPRSQLYRAGDRARFEAAREIRLDVGNAGAVSMTVNGRPARSIGTNGTTARLRITPENAAEWAR